MIYKYLKMPIKGIFPKGTDSGKAFDQRFLNALFNIIAIGIDPKIPDIPYIDTEFKATAAIMTDNINNDNMISFILLSFTAAPNAIIKRIKKILKIIIKYDISNI